LTVGRYASGMVSAALRETVDALSGEDRVSLLEYLERTTDRGGDDLTAEQLATVARRDAEMDSDPSIGLTADEFMASLRAKWA